MFDQKNLMQTQTTQMICDMNISPNNHKNASTVKQYIIINTVKYRKDKEQFKNFSFKTLLAMVLGLAGSCRTDLGAGGGNSSPAKCDSNLGPNGLLMSLIATRNASTPCNHLWMDME